MRGRKPSAGGANEFQNFKTSCAAPPTQDVRGVDLQDQPAVPLVCVGTKDGEDGALLPGLRQQLVNVDLFV